LGLIDFIRGTQLAGSGFVAYRGDGARLQRALVSYFLDCHRDNGYEEIAPPFLVRPEIMQGTGQLPKFADQLYATRDDDLLLIPTAEVPVTNLYAGQILGADKLPMRFCAHTPCFRREAGAAGIGTRGITRVHQFEKVEMVWITKPEESEAALETMRAHAETLLTNLGLRYRILDLCTGDIGFGAARTYDLEVWSPGTDSWLEVSSVSTCTDFQARRMGLRYRSEAKAKPQVAHTLNGSGLALPRCLIAVLETYQQADGSIKVPAVLQPYLGGQTELAANAI
jgi:seryl-tRNA synthetase